MASVALLLEPPGTGARRSLAALASTLATRPAPLHVDTYEVLDLPGLGSLLRAPQADVVVACRPVELRPGSAGVGLVAKWFVGRKWADTELDFVAVAHADLMGDAVARTGLPRDRVVATGLPAEAPPGVAAQPPPAGEASIFVQVGGMEEGRLSRSLLQWTLLDPPAEVIFHSGGDARVARILRRDVATYGLSARLGTSVHDIPLLMAAATVCVVPPDGVAVAEGLAAGSPTVVLGAPASAAGCRFLVDRDAAAIVESELTLAADVDVLRQDAARLDRLRAGGRSLSAPGAVDRLADLVERAASEPRGVVPPPRRDSGPVLEDLGVRGGAGAAAAPPPPVDASASAGAVRARLAEVRARLALWRSRATLAHSAGDAELEAAAEAKASGLAAMEARLTAQAASLERRAPPSTEAGDRGAAADADVESRFQSLEVDAALAELKRKMGLP